MIEAALLKASWINSTIIAGFTILLVSLLVRLTGKESMSVLNVEIPIRWAPYLMMPLSLAHLYFAINFEIWVRNVVISRPQQSKEVFIAISERGPFFFNGLMERLQVVSGPFGPVFLMDKRDPTTWLAHAAAITAFLILVRWRKLTGSGRVRSVLFALAVVASNWLIGGGWAVHASCLKRPDVCKPLFEKAKAVSPTYQSF